MFFNFVGLSMNSILRLTVPHLNLSVTQRSIAMHALSCITVFVMTSNAPILFIHNKEYRNAFLSAFKIKNTIGKVTTINSFKNPNLIQNKNVNTGLIPIN
uniref:7TM_GPCR_Srx domain-containing protein n=1 Tax=Meloidogyne hapla TaxID=6305 RepID=A0A1I8B5K9_MELHA